MFDGFDMFLRWDREKEKKREEKNKRSKVFSCGRNINGDDGDCVE